MGVLILFSGDFPGPTAGAKRIEYYKRGLMEEGIDVEVAPVRQNNSGRFSIYLSSFFLPIKSVLIFLRSKKKHDVLFLYGFGWLSHVLLFAVARIYGVKIYLEINEKQGTVYGSRFTELKLVRAFNLYMVRWSYNLFDGFVVISEALQDDMKPFVLRGAKIIKVPIIVDPERGAGIISKPPASFPYILHTGALSDRKDGMAEVFAAFAIACKSMDKKLHFYLTSKQAPRELWNAIEAIVEKDELQDNIHFLGNISEDLILSFQKYTALVIINKHSNEQNLHNFPTKLGEYLTLKIPVITTGVGEMGNYLQDNVNAFIVPLNNINALAQKIIDVLQNPEKSKEIGERGRETAMTHFNYQIQGERLANFLKPGTLG